MMNFYQRRVHNPAYKVYNPLEVDSSVEDVEFQRTDVVVQPSVVHATS